MTTIEQITDRWNYIQGGFTYIDSNNESNGTDNTVQLSANELLGFISKLSDTQATAKASIIDVLIPDAEPAMFEGLPKSFLIMLECDNAYLQTAPETPLDSQFGSVAIALLYRDVAAWCGAESPIPNLMIQEIESKTGHHAITE